MRLHFEQYLPAAPEAVWPFITDPALMNEWSTAHVDLLAPGEDGDVSGVGTVRRVTIQALGRSAELREVIVESETAKKLSYRVVGGLPVRHHEGVMSLTRMTVGTMLEWDVDYAFLLSALDHGARIILERQLRRSLLQLSSVVEGAAELPPGPRRPFADDPLPRELWRDVCRVYEEQKAIADRLEKAGDPKAWFTRVYQYVTENQLRALRAGQCRSPTWVLRVVVRFHDYFIENLRRWMGEAPGWPEEQWRSAFHVMENSRRWYRHPLVATTRGLAKGVQAHIEEDLPRALADVYARYYAGRVDYARFRADYLSMGDIFQGASTRLMGELRERYFPFYLRIVEPLAPMEVRDLFVKWLFYDVSLQRRRAFERGGRLAQLILQAREEGSRRVEESGQPIQVSA
jgi:hypothetical protein